MKTVAHVLAKKQSSHNLVDADTKVNEALAVMKTLDVNYVVVLKNGKYTGIFTERDYAQKVLMMGKPGELTKVEEVMSSNLPTVSSNDSVQNCMMLMNAYKTRYLPVFDAFTFRDVVSMNDLVSLSMNKQHEELLSRSSERIF